MVGDGSGVVVVGLDLGDVVVVTVVITVRRAEVVEVVVEVVVEDLAFVAEGLLLLDTSAGFATGSTAGAPEGLIMHRLARFASTGEIERITKSRRAEAKVVIECLMLNRVAG